MKQVAIVLAAALALAALALLLRYDYVSPDERVDRFTGRPEFRRVVSEWGERDGIQTREPQAEWLSERELELWLQRQRAEESALELERLILERELLDERERQSEAEREAELRVWEERQTPTLPPQPASYPGDVEYDFTGWRDATTARDRWESARRVAEAHRREGNPLTAERSLRVAWISVRTLRD